MAIELQWDIPVPEGMEELQALLERVAEACFDVEGVKNAGFCVRIVDDEQIQATCCPSPPSPIPRARPPGTVRSASAGNTTPPWTVPTWATA